MDMSTEPECRFHIGQKVVCIANGDWSRSKRYYRVWYDMKFNTPKRGDVLTIREMYYDEDALSGREGDWIGSVGLCFGEIRNGIHPDEGREPGFLHWEFAPLGQRSTDISIFTDMLSRVPEAA
jgi:hypothetical protein